MFALIDGDVILYRAAFSVEHKEYWIEEGAVFRRLSDLRDFYAWNTEPDEFPYEYNSKTKTFENIDPNLPGYVEMIGINSRPVLEPVENAYYNVDSMMNSILDRTGASDYKLFFTGDDNFRKFVPSLLEYKGGRPEKPQYYKKVKEYIQSKYKCETHPGLEADDLLGIYGTEMGKKAVICSIDKDLKQVPGLHYNIADQTFETVNEEMAEFNYWSQVITGDKVDNIQGIYGMGPAKALKFLKSLPKEMWRDEILKMYYGNFLDEAPQRFETNLKLLYILRSWEEYETIKEKSNSEEQNSPVE